VSLDHQAADRTNLETARVRLVEGAPPAAQSTPLEAGDALGVGQVKDKKARKSEKKSARSARDPKAAAEPKAGGQGHGKKLKATKRLAAELEALSGTLSDLRGRLLHLHTVQLGHRESTATLSRRVSALDGLAAGAREQGERLAARLDRLAQTVEVLGKRVATDSPANGALDGLAERVSRAETALARLQDQALGSSGTAERALGELEGRLTALQVLLDAQGGRLDRLAGELQVARPVPAGDRPWRGELEILERGLDGRLQRLAEGLRETESEARRRVEESRSWTQAQVARLGWRQALALGLVVALAGGLLALQSWRTDRLVAGTSARPQTLAQPLDASDGIEPVIATPVVAQDLLERLRRLESGLSEASRDLAATRQAAEGSSARLAELAEGRQAVVRRLDTLQRDLSGTDKSLALLQERVARPTSSPDPAPASAPPQNVPTQSVPTPSADPGYAVQLIAYHSRARVAPFAEQHGIGERAVVTESRVGGRRAYVVLLGPYGSEPEAAQALATLSPELRSLGPWVRRLPPGTSLEPWR
jgi:hypothetical protein